LVNKIVKENPFLAHILDSSENLGEVREKVREWIMDYMNENPEAFSYYKRRFPGH
jgi:hypothetical protein